MNIHQPTGPKQRPVRGITCSACGDTYVPFDPFGCQHCGAHGDALVHTEFAGTGVVLQSALVHMHADEAVLTPYAVGTVKLDEGPSLRLPVVGNGAIDGPKSGHRGRIIENPMSGTGAELAFEIVGSDPGEGQ